MSTPAEPTPVQCSDQSKVDTPCGPGVALWYPQMGGYVGKAVAYAPINDEADACIEIWVWHDGEFPFGDQSPRHLHHCDAQQFIEFGETLLDLQRDLGGE